MIQAVIFDCFGVLAGIGYREIYRLAGGDVQQDKVFLDDMLAATNSGMMTSEEVRTAVAEKLGITLDEWRQKELNGEQPHQLLLDYAAELRARGYKTAILSNANVGTLQAIFTPDQLSLFDAVVVSAEVHVMKPNPAIYELVAERLGVDPQNCVFTDDNPDYAQAAEVVGMHGIAYKDIYDFKATLEKLLAQ